jgi:hypothetical protein
MLDAIVAIAAGILLLSHFWLRGQGGGANGAVRVIGAIIGVMALVLGLLGITSVVGVVLFVGGLMLLLEAMRGANAPGGTTGESGINRLTGANDSGRTILGILLLVMGVVILIRVSDDNNANRGNWRWRGESVTSYVG